MINKRSLESVNSDDGFYKRLGFIFWLAFLFLSVFFFKESVINIDFSYESTVILNGNLNPVPFRWGVLPFRIFVMYGPIFNLSLKTIVLFTAIWSVFLRFIVWYICLFHYKNKYASLLVILSLLLSIESYYYSQSLHLLEGSLYFCLFFATLQKDEIKNSRFLLDRYIYLIFILLIAQASHNLVFITCVFILLFYNNKRSPLLKRGIIIATVLISVGYLLYFSPPYEEKAIQSLLDHAQKFSLNNHLGLFKFLAFKVVSLDYLSPLAALLINFYLIYKYKKHLLLFYSLGILGLFILIIAKLSMFDTSKVIYTTDFSFYVDAAFYSLNFIVFAILLYLLGTVYRNKNLLDNVVIKTSVIFILIFYTSRIVSCGLNLKEYNVYMETLMLKAKKEFKNNFFVLSPELMPYKYSKANYFSHYETLLLSKVSLNDPVSILITLDTMPINNVDGSVKFEYSIYQSNVTDDFKNTSEFYFSPEEFKGLNPKYFKFPNYDYKILNREFMSKFNYDYGFPMK